MRQILITCSFLFSLGLSAQHYYVVSVQGTIYANDEVLAPKSRLTHDTPLRFGSEEAEAYVMSPGKGYFTLKARGQAERRGNEFLLAVKDALLPPSEFTAASTRETYQSGEAFVLDDYDLMDFFRGRILYVEGMSFTLDQEVFPLESEAYFSLQNIEAEEVEAYRLSPIDGKLVVQLPEDEVASSKAGTWRLDYVTDGGQTVDEIGQFQLIAATQEAILTELEHLFAEVARADLTEFLMRDALPYVELRYGKINPEMLHDWLMVAEAEWE